MMALAWARVWPKASGTSIASGVVAVVAGRILAALVAGRPAVGVVRTSRPATASAARPTSTIAMVATRLDATRMLPPMRLGPARLTIPTNAATGRRVHLDTPSSMCRGGPEVADPRAPHGPVKPGGRPSRTLLRGGPGQRVQRLSRGCRPAVNEARLRAVAA